MEISNNITGNDLKQCILTGTYGYVKYYKEYLPNKVHFNGYIRNCQTA